MQKWVKLYGEQCLGFWVVGLVLFVLQELPYLVMFFIQPSPNPIMHMVESSTPLNIIEKVLGISCIVIMCFLIHGDRSMFDIGLAHRRIGFFLAIVFLLAYYFGWVLYFNGHQSLNVMLGFLVAMPPLYYSAIGVWRENWVLFILGLAFGVVHLVHVYGNLVL